MSTSNICSELEILTGKKLFDYQVAALKKAAAMGGVRQRMCLYYKTGAGKSLTALGCMLEWGHKRVLVVAPPATHRQWTDLGTTLGMDVGVMSHAKFRMKDTLLSRSQPVIADEMHLFGSHDGKGWKKLDTLALHLQAPMIIMSATPNYNDADRVYCVQHILDPGATQGGFLAFLYRHCTTEQNMFGQMPKVTGFQRYPDAASFLAAMPKVAYLADDLVIRITDIQVPALESLELDSFGYNVRDHRMVASQMEERHVRTFQGLVNEHGRVKDEAYQAITEVVDRATTPVLLFCTHATIATALHDTFVAYGVVSEVVTGDLSAHQKQLRIQRFLKGQVQVLVGTATLATGTDGLDKVCDTLVIVDDTDDDALRRQLVGRIMPRGVDVDAGGKHVVRLVQI